MAELITMKEATERVGVSPTTFRKRVRDWGITIYTNPRDVREKLVDWDEVQRIPAPAGPDGPRWR